MLSLISFVGCDGGGVETVPVSGRITYGGGSWPKPGMLYFIPLGADTARAVRPATAGFDKEGNFIANSFAKGDGLVPGEYSVRIECWKEEPSADPTAPASISYVPPAFRNGTSRALKVSVPENDSTPIEVTWNVPKS